MRAALRGRMYVIAEHVWHYRLRYIWGWNAVWIFGGWLCM